MDLNRLLRSVESGSRMEYARGLTGWERSNVSNVGLVCRLVVDMMELIDHIRYPDDALPGSRIIASPYAKKLAEQAGISLSGVVGTGPEGRIVAEDVQKAVASGKVRKACSSRWRAVL